MRKGIGSHQSSNMGKDEWITPPELIEKFPVFDLDPCSPVNPPWKTANKTYNIHDNGLIKPWEGRIWLNPPYGKDLIKWMRRMKGHNNGIALIFARTETKTFFETVWDDATGILFVKGRITFYNILSTPSKRERG